MSNRPRQASVHAQTHAGQEALGIEVPDAAASALVDQFKLECAYCRCIARNPVWLDCACNYACCAHCVSHAVFVEWEQECKKSAPASPKILKFEFHCPLCRVRVSLADSRGLSTEDKYAHFQIDSKTANAYNSLRVNCNFGCGAVLSPSAMNTHMIFECARRTVKCAFECQTECTVEEMLSNHLPQVHFVTNQTELPYAPPIDPNARGRYGIYRSIIECLVYQAYYFDPELDSLLNFHLRDPIFNLSVQAFV